MKNLKSVLKEFINEDRKVIGKLPFDLDIFEKFIQDAILNYEYDDSPYWEEMRNIIYKEYDSKIWRWFYGFCESYNSLVSKGVSIEDFYNMMKQIPIDRFNRVLGAGSNGIVLDIPNNNKIIKIFYEDHININDEPFIKWCYKHNSNVFPKVYKIGKNWCIMEKLAMHTQKCKKYIDIIDNETFGGIRPITDIGNGKTVKNIQNLSKEQLEVYNWLLQVKKEMSDINSKLITYPGDLNINNIGERKNGDIIFFDV